MLFPTFLEARQNLGRGVSNLFFSYIFTFYAIYNIFRKKMSLLVNFSCELGQIMTKYDLVWARRVILSNVQVDSNFT